MVWNYNRETEQQGEHTLQRLPLGLANTKYRHAVEARTTDILETL